MGDWVTYEIKEKQMRYTPAVLDKIKQNPMLTHYEIERDGRLLQNTRPQSLYNLRYVRRPL